MRTAAAPTLKSFEFRRERESTWLELEALIDIAQKRGIHALSAEQLTRLPHLYRATLSSLSVARAISLDRNAVEYLESLTARAYIHVYGPRRRLGEILRDFVVWRFPAGVRRYRFHIAMAALFFFVGVFAAFFLTLDSADRFYTFVDDAYAQGRGPATSTSELRAGLYDTGAAADTLATFAASLFSHNAKIGILAFALGFVLGLPVFWLMFVNGLILGAFAALFHSRGLSADLWGWLLPHGITEIGAVLLCGGLGLVLAQSLVFPGRSTRLRNLAERGREAGVVVIGAVILFFIAGLIEGIFRQVVTDIVVRYCVALATLILWGLYFGLAGREEERAAERANRADREIA